VDACAGVACDGLGGGGRAGGVDWWKLGSATVADSEETDAEVKSRKNSSFSVFRAKHKSEHFPFKTFTEFKALAPYI
jgi:hypothetical protein